MIKVFTILLIISLSIQANEASIKEQKLKILKELSSTLDSGETKKIFSTYKKLAHIYAKNGEFYRAIEYYKLAIKLYLTEEKPKEKEQIALYKNLSYCYRKIGNTFKSFKYAYKAVKLASKSYGKNSKITKKLNKEIKELQSRLIAASI